MQSVDGQAGGSTDMINEPNGVIVKGQAKSKMIPVEDARVVSSLHQTRGGRVALWGGSLLVALAFTVAGIVTQMSGCCGGAPTHGCKFVETVDAMMDMSSDMMLPCGTSICEPGVTTCCLEAETEPPLRCIPLNQVCKGQSANCSGDQDCPVGASQHCCGNLETMSIQCQSVCSGNYTKDNTVRVCRVDMECPAEFPKCGAITIAGQTLFVCLPAS